MDELHILLDEAEAKVHEAVTKAKEELGKVEQLKNALTTAGWSAPSATPTDSDTSSDDGSQAE
jgi:hypothetical protein